jgi:hypothetical protein
MDTTKKEPMMLDPKPYLSPQALAANVDYWTNQLNQLDQQRTMILEQLTYWRGQLLVVNQLESNK